MSLLASFRQWCRPRLWLLWLPLSLLWLESVVHVYAFRTLLGRWLIYVPLFSIAIGLLLDFICCMLKPRGCRRLAILFLLLCTFWYMVQTVYCNVSTTFLTLYSVGTGAGPITQFWREILLGILHSFPVLLLEAIPFALMSWLGLRRFPIAESTKRTCRRLFISSVAFHAIAILLIFLPFDGLMSPQYLYLDSFIPELTISNFGVLTSLRLDARQLIFGQPETPPEDENSEVDYTFQPAPSVQWDDNVMDLDFEALAAAEEDPVLSALHTYFGSREPTSTNQYTGMFEGKNLIFIMAESFSPYAVDETLTPTLYKLANSGFQFENFYTPLWWVSTSDGEYVSCQSLIPEAGVWSMSLSGTNTLPFTLGNQFQRLGYKTLAYHDHFWDYYDRDTSHPNMGYDYKGRGHGLEVSDTFPESDLEMMELSIPEYLDDTPFHVYYMTVSGHMNYTFVGNDMSAKHREAVENLDLSEEAQAYLACNIELDLAMEYLLDQLDQAGILEDTVICLTADHYPYGLSKTSIDELAGHKVEENFELYESILILWSGDMETPIFIEKPCSNLDILPTLSNLFGLEYDSRLMMGRDILSDSEGLVVFSNHSFITEHGYYNARLDEFVPYDDVGVPESYAQKIMEQVNDMFYYSCAVLNHDYYSKLNLFETGIQP